uniref:DUF4587 domain-containing protein n=1 Tax=Cyclopterus lumpus TaxID=8103 RepID=A0A8C2WT85_CYCLU
KQDLLKRLREEHILEDLNRRHRWGGSHIKYKSHFFPLHQPAPALSFLVPPPPAPPQPPHIIQQTLPQQPATIIQELPQQQPLITQIPPPQPYPPPRSGGIKEDVVELMLMQNAQMHQIIMHTTMLKATPPMLPPMLPPVPCYCAPQMTYLGGSAVHHHHHHHHYGTTPAAPQLPPISHPTWPPELPSVLTGHAGGQLPSVHHETAPFTLPPLHAISTNTYFSVCL